MDGIAKANARKNLSAHTTQLPGILKLRKLRNKKVRRSVKGQSLFGIELGREFSIHRSQAQYSVSDYAQRGLEAPYKCLDITMHMFKGLTLVGSISNSNLFS